MRRRLLAALTAALLALAAAPAPARAAPRPHAGWGADTAAQRPLCTTNTVTVWHGRTALRVTVRACGTRVCVRTERLLPGGRTRVLADTCPAPVRRPAPPRRG